MKPFTETMRYEYPLTPDSLVLDCGGYEGSFAAEIFKRYGCKVVVFEPIPEFAGKLKQRFNGNPRIEVVEQAVGGVNRDEEVCVKGDSSGMFAETDKCHMVDFISIVDVMGPDKAIVDLLKLNVEGAEFEILEAILKNGLAKRFKNIQVQFHPVVPDFEVRYSVIQIGLAQTHELTFDAGWVWQNWRLL